MSIKITGLPSNDEFEDDEEKKVSKKDPRKMPPGMGMIGFGGMDMSNISPEDLKQALEESQKLLDSLTTKNPNILAQLSDGIQSDELIEALMRAINAQTGSNTEEEDDDDSDVVEYTLGFIEALDDSRFGSISCVRDRKMLDKIKEKYGTDRSLILDIFNPSEGIKDVYRDKLTKDIDLSDFSCAEIIDKSSYDTCVLVYLHSRKEREGDFGIYAGIIETKPDEFALVISGYGNSFFISNEGTPIYMNTEEDDDMVSIKSDGSMKFEKYSFPTLMAGINYYLAPTRRVLCSPHAFGIITTERSNIRNADKYLRIGTIRSNESPEAILFKKDMDLDLEKTDFPFYVKFKTEIPPQELNVFSSKFFTVDFNNCELMKYVELKSNDGDLYFELEIEEE